MLGQEARACWEQSEPSFGRAPLACTVLHAMCDSILPCYPGNLRARRGDAMCECVRAPPRADTDIFLLVKSAMKWTLETTTAYTRIKSRSNHDNRASKPTALGCRNEFILCVYATIVRGTVKPDPIDASLFAPDV